MPSSFSARLGGYALAVLAAIACTPHQPQTGVTPDGPVAAAGSTTVGAPAIPGQPQLDSGPDKPPVIAPLPPANQPRRLEVLFLGNDAELHKSVVLASALQAQWAAMGVNFTYTTNLADLNPTTLSQYDVLMLYANHDFLSKSREQALLDFVAQGKGFIGLHSAVGCFGNSDKFIELIGGQFKTHGAGVFTPKIIKPDHPIFEGVHEYTSWDESYEHQRLNPANEVLMERVDSTGHHEPWAWTRNVGKGRVFYLASGHNDSTWKQPDYQLIIKNAILWAAGPEAVKRLQEYAIQPLEWYDAHIPKTAPRQYELLDAKDLVNGMDPKTSWTHKPLTIAEGQKHFQTKVGFEMKLFASEEMIVSPLAMNWDERGRLWVIESLDYPNNQQPTWKGHDRIKILEDTDGDGKADKVTIFAEGISIGTSLIFANGGVIVANSPTFVFLKDTTGDDKADVFEVLHEGWNVGDTHFQAGGLRYGFDNVYWGHSGGGINGKLKNGQHIEFGNGLYRFTADGNWMEHVIGFSNNHWGLGFNEAFDVFGSTANGEHSTYVAIPNKYFAGLPGDHNDEGRKQIETHLDVHPNVRHIRQVDNTGGFTAATGQSFYGAREWPKEFWDKAFVNEPTAHLVHLADISQDGSIYTEHDGWNMVASDDNFFTPIMSDVGPDGQLWILDQRNVIVQHMGYSDSVKIGKGGAYESPLRTHRFGRVYRLVWKGSKPYTPISLSKDRPQQLVETLKNDNLFWRLQAQRLLVERHNTDIIDGVYKIAEDPSVDEIGMNGPVINALWTLQGLGAFKNGDAKAREIATRQLQHKSWAVRENAIRVLPHDAATLQALQAANVLHDSDKRVRLTALLALADYEPSKEIGSLLYQLGRDTSYTADEWLGKALVASANKHRGGFITAFTDNEGMSEFLRVAVLAGKGMYENFENHASPMEADSTWWNFPVPFPQWNPVGSGNGTLWLRKTIEIPFKEGMDRGLDGMLNLGQVNGSATIYVNGRRVSGSRENMWEPTPPATYIPQGILNPGRNVIAVRLAGGWGPPSISVAPNDTTALTLSGKLYSVDLKGDWRIKVEETSKLMYQRPRMITTSAPFAQQFVALLNPMKGLLDPVPPFTPPPTSAAPVATTATPATPGAAAAPPAEAAPDTAYLSIKAIPPMAFDKKVLTVKAGQPVRLKLTNTTVDVQHNWVLFDKMSKKSLEKVISEMLTDAKMADRGYIPNSKTVLAHTALTKPNNGTSTVTFKAPKEPGDYPYICSFPGHWQMMQGVLRVKK